MSGLKDGRPLCPCFGRSDRMHNGHPDVGGEAPDHDLGGLVHDRPVQSHAQAAKGGR